MLGVLHRALAALEMGQDALDHGRVFDAGNDLHLPATGFAGLNIDLEHTLETLRPGHCRVAYGRGRVCARGLTPSAPRRGHWLAQGRVGREHAVVTDQVDAWIGYERRPPGKEIEWLEDDLSGAIPIRGLQLEVNVTLCRQLQSLGVDGGPRDIPAQPFELGALVSGGDHASVQ